MVNAEVVASVISGTCAVCLISASPEDYSKDRNRTSLQVIGTGFLVRHTTVLTNRHVIEEVQKLRMKHSLREEQFYLWFVYQTTTGLQEGYCRFKYYTIAANPQLDVALIEFVRRPEKEFDACQPLVVIEKCEPAIGDAIAVCGYPYGSDALRRETGEFYRYGPVLQQGYVSALAPFNHATHAQVEEILLDTRTAAGMSGAPVIRQADGRVLGIHFAGIEATIAYALPVDTRRLTDWLRAHDEAHGLVP